MRSTPSSRPEAGTGADHVGSQPEHAVLAQAAWARRNGQAGRVTSSVPGLVPSIAIEDRADPQVCEVLLPDPMPAALFTIDEAAAVLHVPRSWLRDRVSARLVPHTRLGRHVRFTPEHLAQIIASGEESPHSTPVPTGGGHRRRR